MPRLACVALLLLGLGGCQGGDDLLDEERFQATSSPDVTLANDVRTAVNSIEPGADPSSIGAELAETLEAEMEAEGTAVGDHKETYQKILDAAKAMANGDRSKLAEIKTLAETLPK